MSKKPNETKIHKWIKDECSCVFSETLFFNPRKENSFLLCLINISKSNYPIVASIFFWHSYYLFCFHLLSFSYMIDRVWGFNLVFTFLLLLFGWVFFAIYSCLSYFSIAMKEIPWPGNLSKKEFIEVGTQLHFQRVSN